MRRRRLQLLTGVLLVWSALALGNEIRRASAGRERHPGLPPSGWLLGGPQAAPLRAALVAVAARLPRGSTVAVASDVWDHDQLHFLTMWCAYALPTLHVAHDDFRRRLERPLYLLQIPPAAQAPADAVAVPLPAAGGGAELLELWRLEPEAP